MNRSNAFSLIELLIVMAIAGILAAIAVPAYKSYITRAKTAAAMHAYDEILARGWKVYNSTGVMPTNLAQFGVAVDGSGNASPMPNSVDEYLVPPYLAYVQFSGSGTVGTCRYTGLHGYISNVGGGVGGTTGTPLPVIAVQKTIWDINGVTTDLCYYSLVNTNSQQEISNAVANCDDVPATGGAVYGAKYQEIVDACT